MNRNIFTIDEKENLYLDGLKLKDVEKYVLLPLLLMKQR